MNEIALNIIAFFMTLAGLFIYLLGTRNRSRNFYTTSVVSWSFIPVFPLVFIMSAFPGSITEGELFNFKVTGAFASYVLLWFGGIKLTKRGVEIDTLIAKKSELEEKCEYVEVINQVSQKEQIKILNDTDIISYEILNAKGKKIAIITGDIANVKQIDIWVNSENTDMQMARFGEKSISSVIRYLGAKKNKTSLQVEADTIYDLLKAKLNDILMVGPGAVIVTGSGELETTHEVKKIFHVASVHGQPRAGYKPIERIQDCITNCLVKTEDEEFANDNLKSILFTLMGTGTGGGNLDDTVDRLIKAAITYLEQKKDSTSIETIYFLAYSDLDLAACKKILLESNKVKH